MKTLTTLSNYYVSLSQNSSTENVTLGKQMINDAHRYLLQKYFNNENTYLDATVANQQGYNVPPNYSKMKDVTITLGANGLKYTPKEVLTRIEWDNINMLPYTSDIPYYYFIYNNVVNIFPIPSSTGNVITFNYKIRVPDLTLDDYSTGTVSVTNDGTTVTGSGTSWLSQFLPSAGSVINESLWIKFNYPNGDGNWYQISSIASNTSLTLVGPYMGQTASSVTYTIGQIPLLLEDFHDLTVYRPLNIYFSSIRPDPSRASEFKALYNEGIERLDDYSGSKSVNVDLGDNANFVNPNLFYFK